MIIEDKKKLIAVFCIGFLLRVFAGAAVDTVVSGTYGYLDIAYNLIDGKGYFWDYTNNKDTLIVTLATFRPPIYTLFYTFLIWFFNAQSLPIIIGQSLIGATVPIILYFIAIELWNRRVAWIACLISMVYPHLLTRTGNVSEDNLYIPLIYLSILFTLYFIKSRNISHLILSSTLLGIALLTRQTIVLFIPLTFLYIIIFTQQERIKYAIVFAITILICIIPWIVFHYNLYGSISLSDSSGRSLWTGNNQLTYDIKYYPYDSIDKVERALWKTIPKDEVDQLRQMNTVQQDHYFMQRGKDYIIDHPIQFFQSFFTKNLGLFGFTYNPYSQAAADSRSTARQAVHVIFYAPLLVLGILGGFLAVRQQNKSYLLILLLVSFNLISWVFWSHTRHAIPYHPVWILFTSFTLIYLRDAFAARMAIRSSKSKAK